MDPNVIEILSDAEHASWARWMDYLFTRCTPELEEGAGKRAVQTGNFVIPASLVERWKRQAATPYSALSESEQQSDRNEVNEALSLLTRAGYEIVHHAPTTTRED